jgi:transcriptional regulator with XRE-family HTH domain
MENRLKVRRAERNVTQFTLGQLVGVSDTQISMIERGLIDPSPELIDALARALDTTRTGLFPALAEQQVEAQ